MVCMQRYSCTLWKLPMRLYTVFIMLNDKTNLNYQIHLRINHNYIMLIATTYICDLE